MKLSPWWDAIRQPPVHVGWYDVMFSHQRRFTGYRSYWDGNGWKSKHGQYFWFSHTGDKWRGVLREDDE